MKRVIASLFGTIAGLVLLLSFKTHPASVASAPAPTTTDTGTSGAGSSGGGDAGGTPTRTPSSTTPTPKSTSSTKTYTGDSIDTQWGPVQVQITVSNGTVTAANAVVYPTNNPRDVEINNYAIPALNQEAVTAGSAQIDMISGATYTSEGYLGSLQSALDKAGL